MPPQQVLLFIVGTIVILFAAYYVTYYVGMKATGKTRGSFRNRNINLLDRYAIARDKQFCVVEIAGKVYIVGVTNHTMTLLDTLDAAAFAELTKSNENTTTPWSMTPVGQYGNKLTRKVVDFIAVKTGKKQQYDSNAGTADFASSLKEAEMAANEKETIADEVVEEIDETEDRKDALDTVTSEDISSDDHHESMKAWRKTDAD